MKIDSYLTFKLDEESFAINVEKVLSILEYTKITKVPNSPSYLKGAINLRGKVLPVIDLRIRFGLAPITITKSTVILVVILELDGGITQLGILVDAVHEVLEIKDEMILPTVTIGTRYKSEFINGLISHNDAFLMLIDLERVFTTEETYILASNIENITTEL